MNPRDVFWFAAEITQRIKDSGTPVISIENHIPEMPVFYVDNREAYSMKKKKG